MQSSDVIMTPWLEQRGTTVTLVLRDRTWAEISSRAPEQERDVREEEEESGWTSMGRRGWDAAAAVMSAVGGLGRAIPLTQDSPIAHGARQATNLITSVKDSALVDCLDVTSCAQSRDILHDPYVQKLCEPVEISFLPP